jgi:hypothetical protein
MESNFTPEYAGDNPNRKWVRDTLVRKGMQISDLDAGLRLMLHTKRLLDTIVKQVGARI